MWTCVCLLRLNHMTSTIMKITELVILLGGYALHWRHYFKIKTLNLFTIKNITYQGPCKHSMGNCTSVIWLCSNHFGSDFPYYMHAQISQKWMPPQWRRAGRGGGSLGQTALGCLILGAGGGDNSYLKRISKQV